AQRAKVTARVRVTLASLALGAGLAVSAATAKTTADSEPIEAYANVIPRPALVTPGAGTFVIADGSEISFPKDPEAAHIALYLTGLVGTNGRIKLRPVERSGAQGP